MSLQVTFIQSAGRAFRRAYLMFCRWWSSFGRWGVDRWIENQIKFQSKIKPKSMTILFQNDIQNHQKSFENSTQIYPKSIKKR